MGYSSFSEYILADKMAKDPKTVQEFEEELVNLIYSKGMDELEKFTELKAEMTGNKSAVINSWDL